MARSTKKQTDPKPGVTALSDEPAEREEQKHSVPAAVRGQGDGQDGLLEGVPETVEEAEARVGATERAIGVASESPPEAVPPTSDQATPPAIEQATEQAADGQEEQAPDGQATNEQQSSINLQLDEKPLTSRITEALAGVDRINRTDLCKKLDCKLGEFATAVLTLLDQKVAFYYKQQSALLPGTNPLLDGKAEHGLPR